MYIVQHPRRYVILSTGMIIVIVSRMVDHNGGQINNNYTRYHNNGNWYCGCNGLANGLAQNKVYKSLIHLVWLLIHLAIANSQ